MFEMSIDENWSGPEASPWATTAPLTGIFATAVPPAGPAVTETVKTLFALAGTVRSSGADSVMLLVPSQTETDAAGPVPPWR
jgi:hypothetical protein